MKLKKLFLTAFMFVTFWSNAQTQFETEGVIVPRNIEVNGGKKIQLNGFGTRSKAWVDVYVQALYLTALSQDPQVIMDSETDMAIRIEIISKMVTARKLTSAMEKGFEKSCGEKLNAMMPKINQFKSLLSEEIVKGDVYVLSYNPKEEAISVTKNDKLKGKVEGKDFKKALFGIWLSNEPADEDLKNELLGKH
ncbi:chalcone isomerase [Flavobacterium covae]|uniref:Chalcone isomerase n=1 Tax=Flavobacterium columnare TaxID=996 RepID=A0AA94F2G8_9FLAO|nr:MULTISPECIES: chalcone isomerase family protein [Flavobacterium]AND65235.1 chalcone isomerase [Flavobacterium covae]MCH4830585.1 chalcone isomerase family protein [Flavobacterium columnare]MCH4833478.1 chalcone isomerase family protein [Flavobacterium columnare]